MTPEQKIFTKIRMLCVDLGYDVYDYLPGDVDYPFVFIGEQFKQDERINKDKLNKSTQVTVHLYHNNYRQRGTFTTMMNNIERAIRSEYRHCGELIDTQILFDNSTNTPLLHGILETNINY